MAKLKVGFLCIDAREAWKEYSRPEPYFGTAPAALLQGFSLIPDEVEVQVLCCIQQPMTAPEKLAANITYHSLLVPRLGWLRTGYYGCIRAVRRKLRELQPDVVHAQGTERDCALTGAFSGFPNVLTIHGNMRRIAAVNRARPFSFNWLAARLESFVLPRTDGVVCITSYTRELVARSVRRTWVVPNAVDTSFFDVEPVPAPERIILCVGTVCLHKNQNQLIRALDPLATQHRFELVFLGGADRASDYGREFFHLLEQRPWCRYGGFADRAALQTALGRATLLVLPSLEDNCPMVVLEAGAAGVPVVAAKIGGVPDLIEENVTGLFCDPHEPAGIRAGVARLLEHPEDARRLAGTARERARERFHPAVIARRHLEVYRDVLSSFS